MLSTTWKQFLMISFEIMNKIFTLFKLYGVYLGYFKNKLISEKLIENLTDHNIMM